jgi:hypothetical protein
MGGWILMSFKQIPTTSENQYHEEPVSMVNCAVLFWDALKDSKHAKPND